jgi:uncharacterized membrane protein (DUF373 family)
MENISEIEEKPGVVSSMRKNVKKAVVTGIVMIISGIILGAYSTITEKSFELISFYSLLVTSGAGLIALALGAKAWQSSSENSNQ